MVQEFIFSAKVKNEKCFRFGFVHELFVSGICLRLLCATVNVERSGIFVLVFSESFQVSN